MVALAFANSYPNKRSAPQDQSRGENDFVRAAQEMELLDVAVEARLALLSLKEPQRTILLLYALGENAAAISRALGWTPAQVDEALERGLAQVSDAGGGGEPWELR
jgi:DNA-directed RNA polymerase specialized sigma24 family protein